MASFSSQIDNWTRKSLIRMDAVTKQAMQDLAEATNEPRAKGGLMPVKTSFLRNSFAADVNTTPKGDGATRFSMKPIIVAIMKAQLGDRVVFGWSANYAPYMESRYAFIRSNAQRWPDIVREAVKKVKRDYNDAI